MSTDYATKERAFLDSLAADTGRDLAGWMRAIGEAGLPHRNDTIDWLRQQGFPFSRASWLERIHHNGGRPIYADAQPRPAANRRTTRTATPVPAAAATAANGAAKQPEPSPAAKPAPQPAPAAPPAQRADAALQTASGPALDRAAVVAHLAPAKAYRPLAQHLIAAIERAIPALTIHAADGLLMLRAPDDFAAILPGPRDIRLGIDGGEATVGPHMLRSRLPGAPPEFAHTIVLDDARQLNPELIAVIEAAQRRATQRA